MRADRLLSILMLLQTHEKMTAEQLAGELEVSPRTIYRDITALNTSGVPIYMERGPGGGIALVDSYRTTLTGMNAEEAQALFMLSIPEALNELGVGQRLKAALLKLTVALPQNQRMMAERTQQRVFLDSTAWKLSESPVVHLEALHEAVWDEHILHIAFQGSFDARIEVDIAPFGLVAKMNTWYLVGKVKDFIKVIKVRDILDIEKLEDKFTRDEDFDLMDTWNIWCDDYRSRRPVYPVKVKLAPVLVQKLERYLSDGARYELLEHPSEDGWQQATIYYENAFGARENLLGLGRAVEVIEPEPLRRSLIDYARQIVDFYQGK